MGFYHIVQSQCTENRALFLVTECNVQPRNRNRNRKADSEMVRNRKVQALQIGRSSASGENQIQRVTSDIDRHLTCCVKLRQSASDKNSLANEDLLESA